MKHLIVVLRTSALIALSIALAAVSYGQNRERFGISAKAGGINSVIGRVLVKRTGQSSQEDLSAKDDLTSGDVVTTRGGSRVEVLLRSEEHTSELQSRLHLVCRLLLEK